METLSIHRAVEEIRLSDAPDAPVARMSMDAASINEAARGIAAMQKQFAELKAKIAKGEVSDKDAKRIAKVYRDVLDVCLGQSQRRAIYKWIKGGKRIPDEDINHLISPLVVWCQQNILDAVMPKVQAEAFAELTSNAAQQA